MQVDIQGIRIVFAFLTLAMLILAQGLFFNYGSKIFALASGCMAIFFFITVIRAKQLAQANFKFNKLQKISIVSWVLLTALGLIQNAT